MPKDYRVLGDEIVRRLDMQYCSTDISNGIEKDIFNGGMNFEETHRMLVRKTNGVSTVVMEGTFKEVYLYLKGFEEGHTKGVSNA